MSRWQQRMNAFKGTEFSGKKAVAAIRVVLHFG
jgi:hypothetical protein